MQDNNNRQLSDFLKYMSQVNIVGTEASRDDISDISTYMMSTPMRDPGFFEKQYMLNPDEKVRVGFDRSQENKSELENQLLAERNFFYDGIQDRSTARASYYNSQEDVEYRILKREKEVHKREYNKIVEEYSFDENIEVDNSGNNTLFGLKIYNRVIKEVLYAYANKNIFQTTQYASEVMRTENKRFMEIIIRQFFKKNFFLKYDKSIDFYVAIEGIKDGNFNIKIQNSFIEFKLYSTIGFGSSTSIGRSYRENESNTVGKLNITSKIKTDSSDIHREVFRLNEFDNRIRNSVSRKNLTEFEFVEPEINTSIIDRSDLLAYEKLLDIIVSNRDLVEDMIRVYLNSNEIKSLLFFSKMLITNTIKLDKKHAATMIDDCTKELISIKDTIKESRDTKK